MTYMTICGSNISELSSSPSPFSKLIALDYYDGPLSGVVQCATGSTVYKFQMLDWDDHWNVRIFSFARLPPEVFGQIEEMFSRYDKPRWPMWMPHWNDGSTGSRERIYHEAERLAQETGPIEFIVVALDPMREILQAHEVTQQIIDSIDDWFTFLGLSRNSPNPD